jgi:Nitroreductase family
MVRRNNRKFRPTGAEVKPRIAALHHWILDVAISCIQLLDRKEENLELPDYYQYPGYRLMTTRYFAMPHRLHRKESMNYPHSYRSVDDAILSRRSVRAFLPQPVGKEVVSDILAVAQRAPSGTNTQPWRVHALAGQAQAELSRKILAVHDDPQTMKQHAQEYAYYPRQWTSPYLERRRKVGWDCTDCWASAGRTTIGCTISMAATTASSMRRSG